MLNLSDRDWKKFGFADIFEIKKGFYNKKPRRTSGAKIPFLGATDSDNGITIFLTLDVIQKSSKTGHLPNEPLDRKLFPGHAIAVTNNGSVGHAYYQATQFTCSHDINPLYLKDHSMSKLEALFLIPLIEQQGKLFQYARKWRPSRMVNSKIMLPVNAMDQPDYDFMSDYVRERLSQKRQSYLDDVHDRLAELGTVQSLPAINSVDWKPFVISELFSKLVGGKGKGLVHLRQVDSGGIEYLGATNRNNGVLCRVALDDVSKPMVQSGNCIGFIKNGDGAAGYAVYKKEPFISTTDVIYGYADWLNPYTGLFFVGSQDLIRPKYGHGYKRNARHLRVDKVMLPAMSDGTPDYKYMEQYVKNKMIQKYNNYLQYINAR